MWNVNTTQNQSYVSPLVPHFLAWWLMTSRGPACQALAGADLEPHHEPGSEYWPLIGPHRSRDLNTGLWLVRALTLSPWQLWVVHTSLLQRHDISIPGLWLVSNNHVTWMLTSYWSTLSLFSASSQIKTHHRHRNSNQEPFYAPLKTFRSFFCTESFSIIRAGLRIKLSRKRSWIEMAERQNIIHTMEISGLRIVLIWGLECQWRLSLQAIIRWKMIMASDWSRQITWPGYWALIGQLVDRQTGSSMARPKSRDCGGMCV